MQQALTITPTPILWYARDSHACIHTHILVHIWKSIIYPNITNRYPRAGLYVSGHMHIHRHMYISRLYTAFLIFTQQIVTSRGTHALLCMLASCWISCAFLLVISASLSRRTLSKWARLATNLSWSLNSSRIRQHVLRPERTCACESCECPKIHACIHTYIHTHTHT